MRRAATSFIGFEGENDEGEEVEKATSTLCIVGKKFGLLIVVRSHGGRLPDTIFPQNISSLHSIIFPQNHINIFLNILCQATYPHGIS